MEWITVKLDYDGSPIVDGQRLDVEAMAASVRAVVSRGGGVRYFRERPTQEANDAASLTFQRLIALRPPIQLGDKAPSEWGRLDWFEFEEKPQISRIFFARAQKFLVGVPEVEPVLVGGPLVADAEASVFGELQMLVSSDRVIETPMRNPQEAFLPQGGVGTHLRIAYEDRRWAAWWPPEAVPSNIQSLRFDLGALARRLVGGGGRELSPGEASTFFRPQ